MSDVTGPDVTGLAEFEIRARAFVNATGPFSDVVRSLASAAAPPRMHPSKGPTSCSRWTASRKTTLYWFQRLRTGG